MDTTVKPVRHTLGITSFIILCIFATIFLTSGIAVFRSLRVNPAWTRTSGRVIALVDIVMGKNEPVRQYAPVVEYIVNDRVYQVNGSVYSSKMPPVGEARDVVYDPADPLQAKVDEGTSGWAFPALFAGLGVAAFVMLIVTGIRAIKRGREITELQMRGHRIKGLLARIEGSIQINKQDTYRAIVTATGPDGIAREYHSDRIIGVAPLQMRNLEVDPVPVDVLVDPANAKSYYVDIDMLPALPRPTLAGLMEQVQKENTP